MRKREVLTIAIVLLMATVASACNVCGFRSCRIVKRRVVKRVIAAPVLQYRQAYAVQPRQITIQNNYNGQPLQTPFAVQGQTVYGYGASGIAQQFRVDPTAQLREAARLVDRAQTLAQQSAAGYQATLQLALRSNNEVAKIMAATQHLQQAMQVQAGGSMGGTIKQELKIKTDKNGKTTVESVPPLPAAGQPAGAVSSGMQVCLKCHSGAEPKKGFSLEGETIDPSKITLALRRIRDGTMPPADAGVTLTPVQKAEILNDLLNRDASK